jgi:hypothetical protein
MQNFLLLGMALGLAGLPNDSPAAERPNIVFILADDNCDTTL